MNNHYVYELTNKINGMKYIGKRTCHCPIENDKNYMGSGVKIVQAVKEYGKNNFEKKILKTFNTSKEALEYERYVIESVEAYDDNNYYNITHGGFGALGYKPTEEAKRKNLETKIKNGTLPIGEKNPMYGRTGEKNPKSKKAIMFDKDLNIIKIFESLREVNDYFNKSRAISYISKRCVNGGGSAYGYIFMFYDDYLNKKNNGTIESYLKKLQEDFIIKNKKDNKLNIFNSKPIYQIDIEDMSIIDSFANIVELCSKYKNIDRKNVKRILKHGANTTNGMSFIFKDEYESLPKDEIYKLYHNKQIGKKNPYDWQSKAVRCLNNGMVFKNKKEASEYFGYKDLPIDKVCSGKREYGGRDPVTNEKLFWEYV